MKKITQPVLEVYSDESGIKRFKSLCAISGIKNNLDDLSGRLKSILLLNDVKEIKFEWVRTHSPKIKTAKKFLKLLLNLL